MRFKVCLAYDGRDFYGWQKQKDVRTVQEEIENILSKIEERDVSVHASGRTDAGVHALGQVFHFNALKNLGSDDWFRILSGLSAEDIAIKSVEKVADDFHARFDAKAKHYRYYVNLGSYNVFDRDYVYQFNENVDFESIQKACFLLEGTHDFTSFNATKKTEIENQVRTLYTFKAYREDELLIFDLIGDGFLRYMVRILIGAVLEIGKGNHDLKWLSHALEKKEKGCVPYRVPPVGLYLKEVKYDSLDI